MNSVSLCGVMNRLQRLNYSGQGFKKNLSSGNVQFSEKTISQGVEKNNSSFFSKILSKLNINRNKENKQLIKQIDDQLKDEGYVNELHTSFSPKVGKFIFGNDTYMKQAILPKVGIVYKTDNHYVVQTWKDDMAVFKKLDKKGNLIDTIYVPGRAV